MQIRRWQIKDCSLYCQSNVWDLLMHAYMFFHELEKFSKSTTIHEIFFKDFGNNMDLKTWSKIITVSDLSYEQWENGNIKTPASSMMNLKLIKYLCDSQCCSMVTDSLNKHYRQLKICMAEIFHRTLRKYPHEPLEWLLRLLGSIGPVFIKSE